MGLKDDLKALAVHEVNLIGKTNVDVFGMLARLDAATSFDGAARKKIVQVVMLEANDKMNRSCPMAHLHTRRSIEGKGNIHHPVGSPLSTFVSYSAELTKELSALKKKGGGKLKRKTIAFRKNQDLRRTLHDAAVSGEMVIENGTWLFNGEVSDTFDFRFDMVPKTISVQGVKLRCVGNLAYTGLKAGWMKSYKISGALLAVGKA